MKILIEIPDNSIIENTESCFGIRFGELNLRNIIMSGERISNNATNGDVIKAMFPNAEIKRGFYGIERVPLVCLDLHTSFKVIEVSCVEDWWNALYKGV